MKTHYILTALLLGFSIALMSQTPKNGAVISLNQYAFEIKSGEVLEIPAQLVRAGRFEKGKISGLVLQQKDGLTNTVNLVEGEQDLYIITIKASEKLSSGTFPLILKAEGRDAYKVKQTMLMVSVIPAQQIVSTNQ